MENKNETTKYTWMPTIKWLLKILIIIYIVITIIFFVLNFLLKDYFRQIPVELTPWLNNTQKMENSK